MMCAINKYSPFAITKYMMRHLDNTDYLKTLVGIAFNILYKFRFVLSKFLLNKYFIYLENTVS